MIKSNLVNEEFEYRGFNFQRLNKDMLWYITCNNRIVNWGKYQNDLKE